MQAQKHGDLTARLIVLSCVQISLPRGVLHHAWHAELGPGQHCTSAYMRSL